MSKFQRSVNMNLLLPLVANPFVRPLTFGMDIAEGVREGGEDGGAKEESGGGGGGAEGIAGGEGV